MYCCVIAQTHCHTRTHKYICFFFPTIAYTLIRVFCYRRKYDINSSKHIVQSHCQEAYKYIVNMFFNPILIWLYLLYFICSSPLHMYNNSLHCRVNFRMHKHLTQAHSEFIECSELLMKPFFKLKWKRSLKPCGIHNFTESSFVIDITAISVLSSFATWKVKMLNCFHFYQRWRFWFRLSLYLNRNHHKQNRNGISFII